MNTKMISIVFVLITLLMSFSSWGSEHQRINTLGVSKKGQFVAIEEYGYLPTSNTYKVSIRILNVWTKEFVGESVALEEPARRADSLQTMRERARFLAHGEMAKFNIHN
jgi:predicted secreted protein